MSTRPNARRAGLQTRILHTQADGLPEDLVGVTAVVLNPPWINEYPKEHFLYWSEPKRRCMIDIDHKLLYRIIRSTVMRVPLGSAVWFVLGVRGEDSMAFLNKPPLTRARGTPLRPGYSSRLPIRASSAGMSGASVRMIESFPSTRTAAGGSTARSLHRSPQACRRTRRPHRRLHEKR